MPREEPTFYLYKVGLNPEKVVLGHLVHGNYATPVRVKNYSIPRLSEDELTSWADVHDWKGALKCKDESNYGIEVAAAGIGQLGVGLTTESERVIIAEKGRRILINDVTKFFSTKILENRGAREQLQTWVSVKRSKYMLQMMGLRKPSIWCLTGLYELTDAKSCIVDKTSPSAKIGIDAAAMTAIFAAPVGFSLNLGHGTTLQSESELSGTMIWAAQYQLIDTRYFNSDGQTDMPLNWMSLHPDGTYCEGQVLGEEDEPDVAELAIQGLESSHAPEEEVDEEYWKEYAVAEERILEDIEDNWD